MHPVDHHRHCSTAQCQSEAKLVQQRAEAQQVFPGLSGALVQPLRRGTTGALALLAQVARRSGGRPK